MDALPAVAPTQGMVMQHGQSAVPAPAYPSFPMVTPHMAPDSSGAMTNLSDEDYAKFKAGQSGPLTTPPAQKADTSWQDALPAVQPTSGMQMAAGKMPYPQNGGVVANLGAGTSGAVADTLGMPVDALTGAINLGLRGVGSAARAINPLIGAPSPPEESPQITNPVGGSDWLKKAFGYVGANPNDVVANNEIDRMARGAGAGVAGMVLPFGAARALPALSGIPGAIQSVMGAGSASPLAGAAAAATIGAAAGGTGQLAEDSVPAPYKPIANFLGNVVGGGLPIAARAAGAATLNAVRPVVSHYVAPLTEAGRSALAGQRIAGAATDANAVRDTLANQPAPLVPGSQPTTYQLTGDQGLGNLERVAAKNNPEAFLQRAGQQNAARVAAIPGQSETASPAAIETAFRGRLAAIDAQGEQDTVAARAAAQGATEGLGGAVPVGADQQTSVLQSYGQRLRGPLDEANQAQRARVSRLYDAVDPDGKLAVDMSGIKKAARDIAKDIPKNEKAMEGDAGSILGTMQMQPKVQTFREVSALRSRLTDAMREELYANGRSQTYRRLSQMLGAVDDTLANGVEEAASNDGGVAARLDAMAHEEAGGPVAGAGSGQGNAAGSSVGAAGLPGASGGESAGIERSGNAGGTRTMETAAPASGAGLTEWRSPAAIQAEQDAAARAAAEEKPTLTPNYDPEAEARYRAANAGHAERVSTFETAPGVGQVLATGARKGEWKLGDSQVAATIFNAGKGAAERVQAFLKAGGNNADLVSDLKDYAAFSLRRAAEDADGMLNPAKATKWLDDHGEALSQFPDLAAKFRNAAAARTTLDEVAAQHLAARQAFEKSAASHFLGDADPVMRMGRILKSDTADATMAELATLTKDDPAAREGMRKAVADYVKQELRSNAVAGDTAERAFKMDAFQTFVRRAAPALRHIFEPEEIEGMQNIGTDMQQSNRSIVGTKLPGGSNTAQDIAAGLKHGEARPSVLGLLIAAEAAGEAAQHIAGPLGRAVGMVLVPLTNAMRQQGLQKVDDLVTQAMLHPELARALLAKVPAGSFAQPVARNAARQIMALSGVSAGEIARQRMQSGGNSGNLSPP